MAAVTILTPRIEKWVTAPRAFPMDTRCASGGIDMKRLTTTVLKKENERFAGTGGRSEVNRDLGFRPAFFDCSTCAIYLSRFRDGRIAPLHILDGLPDEVVLVRSDCGRVVVVKSTLVSGFER